MCMGFPHTTKQFLDTSWGVLHFDLILTDPEIASDSTGEGLSPTRPSSISDARHKPRLFLCF